MKRDVETPKEYLADLPADQHALVMRIRKAVRKVMPKWKEELQYGMLDYPGLCNLGAQKHYVALYVAPKVLARHRKNFPGVDAGKSCLRFKRVEQADASAIEALLGDVLEYREAETD